MRNPTETTPRNQRPLAAFTACAVVAMLGAMIPATATHAAELPGNRAVSDFELTHDYLFELDGQELVEAEIYYSRYEVAYLVIAPELTGGLFISPRGYSVQRLRREKFEKRQGIHGELAAGAVLEDLGQYQRRWGEMSFTVDGKTARLKDRPPLLGRHSSADLRELLPKYDYLAKVYGRSKRSELPELPKADQELRIRVYFGSKSPFCQRVLPRIMAVEEKLRSSRIRFEYYALPPRIIDDPIAREERIYGVPTAVITRNGEEIGRLTALPLRDPADALHRLLTEDNSQ